MKSQGRIEHELFKTHDRLKYTTGVIQGVVLKERLKILEWVLSDKIDELPNVLFDNELIENKA